MIPLLEVILRVNFEPVSFSRDALQYFYRINSDLLPESRPVEEPDIVCYHSMDRQDSLLISQSSLKLQSRRGVSFPKLRPTWTRELDSFLDVFSVTSLKRITLEYRNEIPIADLRSFQNYVNVNFEMPAALKERMEFFRTEFTYQYAFGEIKVWLQPDWDDQADSYCILLNLESSHAANLDPSALLPTVQQMHEGMKDVFRQVLSQDYIRSLPQ